MLLQRSGDPYTLQGIAYALARAGDVDKAITELNQLVQLLETSVKWQQVMIDRALYLSTLLLNDLSAAQKQLDAWEAETVRNLNLEKFWLRP